MGIASIRRLSRPSGRIETQDVSGPTDNPLGLVSLRQAQDKRQAQPKDTSLVSIRLRLLNTSRSYSAGAGFVLPRLFEKIRQKRTRGRVLKLVLSGVEGPYIKTSAGEISL